MRRFSEPDYRQGILSRQLYREADFVNRPNA
jgi:hypothetical protein